MFYKGVSSQDELLSMISDDDIESYNSKPQELLIFDDSVSDIQDDLMAKLFTVLDIIKTSLLF